MAWIGAVPKLAICKHIETTEFHLSHCSNDWTALSMVEAEDTLAGIQEVAEKHYKGITDKWIPTNYTESDATKIFDEEKEKMRCSFKCTGCY